MRVGTLYDESSGELTEAEREVLVEGGVCLDAEPEGDPLAATTAQFAAIVSTSLTTEEAAVRLGMSEGRIRQLIARRTLYSVLLDNRRYIPAFQFVQRGDSARETGPRTLPPTALWCRTSARSMPRCLKTCIPSKCRRGTRSPMWTFSSATTWTPTSALWTGCAAAGTYTVWCSWRGGSKFLAASALAVAMLSPTPSPLPR